MKDIWPFSHETSTPSLARIIPARGMTLVERSALEGTMQSLVLQGSALALEIASTPTDRHQARSVQFLLRAPSEDALRAATRQIQVRYPQAIVRPVPPEEDPFEVGTHAFVSAMELRAGGAAYETLRSWSAGKPHEQGSDPLIGVLTTLEHLPVGMRAVTQLVLTPLPPTWARKYQRLSVEHPLEEEREQRREAQARLRRGAPSWEQILLLGIVVGLLVTWNYAQAHHLLPRWLQEDVLSLLHGSLPHLSSSQQAIVGIGLVVVIMLIAVLGRGIRWLGEHVFGGTRYYDMKRVAEKIGKSAYRAHLRVYLIEEAPRTDAHQTQPLMLNHTIKAQFTSSWHAVQRKCAQQRRHQQIHAMLFAAYRHCHTSTAYFTSHRLSTRHAQRLTREGTWWRGLQRATLFLTGEEVATLWHLPSGDHLSEGTNVEQRQERSLLAPHVLTTGNGWQLGTSTHAGRSVPVRFPPSELLTHKFVIGRTGKGKSTLFHHLALAHLSTCPRPHPGLCVIEPHGDLIEDLLGLLPPEREEEVVLIDLHQQGFPPGINPLDATQVTSLEEADLIVSHLLTTFKGIWSTAWGPRVENVMRFSLKTLLEANRTLVHTDPHQGLEQQYTLLDVTVLLNKQSFRARVLDLVEDVHVLDWWYQYYERLDARMQEEITTPVLTKISAYASAPISRRLLGQPTSTINFSHIVEKQQILLLNTASGHVGQDVSSLIGASILGLFSAALSRQLSLPPAERNTFLLLVDEFKNYPVNYGSILSELRKAGTFLVLATQSLAQLDVLDRALRPTVFANADHLFVFTLAGEDAYLLRHELGHLLSPEDVTNLPDYTCYARWSLNGQRLPFFSLTLDLPPSGSREGAERLREQCALRYGRPVSEVDTLLDVLNARHGTRPRKKESLHEPTASPFPLPTPGVNPHCSGSRTSTYGIFLLTCYHPRIPSREVGGTRENLTLAGSTRGRCSRQTDTRTERETGPYSPPEGTGNTGINRDSSPGNIGLTPRTTGRLSPCSISGDSRNTLVERENAYASFSCTSYYE
ncbi:type IV secretory system conjugative DNA transfer family protein [Ktedonobacter racemifer]|uniref:Type IV secretion system coupling protein TraD DNA-binding domain-containing protein n=1 Tax=Ktedonobacter racemifer DSM 44963 TaxID=485913 RepID=D6TGV5_KTERA|nr:type IV secretory system conjugative DNA transfer family protein [Ktedonobacter racemifer]EFH88884.1 hypothetical protein Krac_10390 [Ktedonobacter racemifer DSM 44963]